MSGNEHHGTVHGADPAADRFDRDDHAYAFSGTSYVAVEDHDDFTFGTHEFTIALWARPDRDTGVQYVMGHSDGPGPAAKWIWMFTDHQLGLHERPNGSYWVYLKPWKPVLGEWYHLVLRRRADTFELFVDGSLLADVDDARPLPDVAARLLIGNGEATGRMFVGALDDVRIYSSRATVR